ncbi:acyl carrier protein [Lentzea sp. NPDC003310]|uniref:acyl carrier protein n=1 Tax=Lentzea sp. NPDC003310 TaxID=3154447 RepID=UPI0033AC7A12
MLVSTDSARAWLVDAVARRKGFDPSQVAPDWHFNELGLDSTDVLVLSDELAKWTGVEIDSATLWYFPTISRLAEHVASEAATPA